MSGLPADQVPQDVKESKGQILHLPRKPADSQIVGAVAEAQSSPNGLELVQAYERFQLQVRLDVEQERELLYKSLLVVELIVFLFVLRELLLRWLA